MLENGGIAKVIEGYRHFSEEVYPEHRELFEQLRNKQNPEVLFITCADSRIDPSLITHTDPGDLFICRNIGNIVPAYGEMMGGVSAVVEYAVMALKVTDIIVCGHSDCGAMKALRGSGFAFSGVDAYRQKLAAECRRGIRGGTCQVSKNLRGPHDPGPD